MNIGVILAGGKGTRLNCSDRNKTTLPLNGKPLIQYGVDLYRETVDGIVIVIGAFPDSVKQAVQGNSISFALQEEQLGTGHAAKIAVNQILTAGNNPDHVLIGYGDHMMLYTPAVVQALLKEHASNNAAVTLVSVTHDDPDSLAWGRIMRAQQGNVVAIVEQKDASAEQRAIREVNAGFYCIRFDFLKEAINQLVPSPVTGEYYITDLVALAVAQNKHVHAYEVPFRMVGTGINTADQLQATESMLSA